MTRKERLIWAMAVFGIIGTVYGLYSLIYNVSHGNNVSILSIFLLSFGVISLGLFAAGYISNLLAKKNNAELPNGDEKKEDAPTETAKEEPSEPKEENKEDAPTDKKETAKPKEKEEYTPRSKSYSYSAGSSYSSSTVYVKQVGYGPILRVSGNQVLDMRNNTYYRIEGNNVNQDGYGLLYEIRGNQIRDAFGGYLYEISGSNINKVFGGFYASVSGNYITLYDSSSKFEMSDSLSKKQLLVVAALLFGRY